MRRSAAWSPRPSPREGSGPISPPDSSPACSSAWSTRSPSGTDRAIPSTPTPSPRRSRRWPSRAWRPEARAAAGDHPTAGRTDHPHLGDEEGTGQRISRGVNVLLGRGDEEPIEVVPAEGAGGRLGSADLDEAVESPVRAVAVDGTAVGHRGPYAPLGIDGEPIGQAALGQFDEDAAVAQPVGGVEVEDGDLPCGRVVVVDERPVGAPVDSVRDGHALEHDIDLPVRTEAVETGRSDTLA